MRINLRTLQRSKATADGFQTIAQIAVIIFVSLCVIPFWLMISGSVTPEADLLRNGYQFIPNRLTLDAYSLLLSDGAIFRNYLVSITVTVIGTILGVIITTALAYTIACKKNPYRRVLAMLVYIPMIFNGGLVPFYILVSQWLGLKDSLGALILPLLVSPFYVMIMVSFLRKIPEEILDSARVDGANEIVIFWKLVVPLAKPAIATISLFYALAYWNDFMMALLFIRTDQLRPLQSVLQNLIANMQATRNLLLPFTPMIQIPGYQLRMATTLITIGPILLVYPIVQPFFVRGLTVGSLKE